MHVFRIGCLVMLLGGARLFAVPVLNEPLRGTVYSADGKFAGGAIVWAAQFRHGPLERREAVADANGRFSLQLTPGKWYVWARRGTQGGEGTPHGEPIEISAAHSPAPLNITLEERGTFRGRLFEAETGKAIVGGQIFLDAGVVLATGAAGRFEIGGLQRSNHEAFVVAPGRIRMRVLFDTTGRADTELDVRVPRAGRITGRVTDVDGKPIAGAHVGRSTSGSYFSINGLYAACDAEGRFAYDDAVPPDQPTRLGAGAPGYEEDEQSGTSPPPDGQPLEMNFRLRPKPGPDVKGKDDRRRVVAGYVLDPNDTPLRGVLVRWGYQPTSDAIQVRTDNGGHFRFTVPDEAGMLAVLPRHTYQPDFPAVAAGGARDVVVRLRLGRTVRGRVVDDAGKPIRDVRVIASIPSPDQRLANPFWLTESDVHTDAAGNFEMTGVPESARFDFLKRGLSEIRFRDLSFTSGDNSVTLQYGGAVKGRVVDRDGKPIRDFRVLVDFPRVRRPGDKTSGFFAGYVGMGVRFTSPDGGFVLTGVGAGGVYRIRVLAEGHGEAVEDRVNTVAANRLERTTAVVLKAGAPVPLRVRALTPEGKPIAGVRVTLVDGQPQLDLSFAWGYNNAGWENMVRGRTGADGCAVFPALGFSGATVLAEAGGRARQRLGWRGGQKELTLTLPPECVIAGAVRDAAGQPLAGGHVRAAANGDTMGTWFGPGDDGRFRFTELPAGTWIITVHSADGLTQLHTEQMTLKAGETRELKIDIKK